MAAQRSPLKVKGQGHAAVRTREDLTAQAALKIIRISTPIEKEDALFSSLMVGNERVSQAC